MTNQELRQSPSIKIIQWREIGDDEDSCEVIVDTLSMEHHLHRISDDNNLGYDTDDSRMVLNYEQTIPSGHIYTNSMGQSYRIDITPGEAT